MIVNGGREFQVQFGSRVECRRRLGAAIHFDGSVIRGPAVVVADIDDVQLFVVVSADVEDEQADVSGRVFGEAQVLRVAKADRRDLFRVAVVVQERSAIGKRVVRGNGVRVVAVLERMDAQHFAERVVPILHVLPVVQLSGGVHIAERKVEHSVVGIARFHERIEDDLSDRMVVFPEAADLEPDDFAKRARIDAIGPIGVDRPFDDGELAEHIARLGWEHGRGVVRSGLAGYLRLVKHSPALEPGPADVLGPR